MKRLLLVVAGLGACLGGCAEGMYDPEYPRSRVVFDEGLLGRWTPVKHDGDPPPIVEVERRDVPVTEGLLRPKQERAKGETPPAGEEAAPAYRVEIAGAQGGEPFKMHGYLIEAGGTRFAGMQVTLSQLSRGAGHPFSIPTHVLCKIERDGDLVRFWVPKVLIAWAPDLVMLDAPEGPPPPIDLDRVGDDVGLTLSIERLVAFCAAHADDPRLYGEAVEFKRAPTQPTEAPR